MNVMHNRRRNILKWILFNFISLTCLFGKGGDAITATRLRPGGLSTESEGFLFGVTYDMQTYENRVLVQLNFSNASLLLEVDGENRTATFTGYDAELTHRQKAKLFSLHRWRSMRFGMKDIISKLAKYSADAPRKHTFSLHRVSVKSGRRSRLSCLTEGDEATAVWTDSNHTVHNVSVIVGSSAGPNYGCMGRCGKGCPKHNKSRVVYTQNCLNHDQCSLESRSRKGMRDKECGEEYKRAMPDYLWGDKTCKRRRASERRQKMRKKITSADDLDASAANASDDAANASDENTSEDGVSDEGGAVGDGSGPPEDGYDAPEAEALGGGRPQGGDARRTASAIVEDAEYEEDEEDSGDQDQEAPGGGISREDLAHIIDGDSFDE